MRKKVCEACGKTMVIHRIIQSGRGLVWVCPPLVKE